MRRAWLTPVVAGLLLAVPLSACSGGESKKDDAKGDEVEAGAGASTTSTAKGDGSSSTTATTVRYFDEDQATTTTAKPLDLSTTTTEFEMPTGGKPRELCEQWTAYEQEFASKDYYDEASIEALTSLRPLLPPDLRDDLDLLAQAFEKLIGKTFAEASDPAVQAEVFVPAVQTSLYQLQTWGDTVCDR